MIENALKSLLNGETVTGATAALTTRAATYSAEVAAIVGKRIYRAQLPRNAAKLMQDSKTMPALWFWRTQTNRQKTHDGPLDLVNAFVSVHSVGLDTLTVNQLLTSVRKLMDNWKGTAGGVTVDKIWVQDGRDYFEDPIGAAELGIAESNIELNCWFREPLA